MSQQSGFGDLFAGLPMMSGKEIYDNFQQGRGPEGLHGASGEIQPLLEEYEQLRKEITGMVESMSGHWKGSAGEAAMHGAGPIAVEFQAAQQSIAKASVLLEQQGHVFSGTKNSVVPVPDEPSPPSGWDVVKGVAVNAVTGHNTKAVNDYESQMSAHNDAAQHNVDMMHRYSGETQGNIQEIPTSYGNLLSGTSHVRIDDGDGGGDSGGSGGSGSSGGSHRGHEFTGGGGGSGGGGTTGGGAASGGGSAGVRSPPEVPGGDTGTSTTGASAAPGYGGSMPGSVPGQAAAASQGGFGPIGSGGGQQGYGAGVHGGAAGGVAYGGAGAGGAAGPGGQGGSGGRAGSGGKSAGPKAGSESGVGKKAPGAAAGEEAAAGKATPKPGSGRGMGMAPRGGGKGGSGGEDYEHERPGWLVEPDPDDFWFGGTPPVAPPVIE